MNKDLKKRMAYVIASVASNGFYRKKYGIEKLNQKESESYIIENFEKLPCLMREELPELHKSCLKDRTDSRVLFTGGTSGVAGLVEWSDEDHVKCVPIIKEALKSCGVRNGATILSTVATTASIYGLAVDMVCNEMDCTLLQCGDAQSYNFRMITSFNEKRRIDVVFGTPMGVLGLTHDKDLLASLKGLKAVVICGSPMDATIERNIRDKFKCEIIDYLGSTEAGMYAYRKSSKDGFTFDGNMLIIESDEEQRVITTNLTNRHMPIIRYRTDDKGYVDDEGKYHLIGRMTETFYIGGTKIPMSLFNDICKAIGASDTYQVIMRKKGTVTELTLNIVDDEREYDTDIVSKLLLENDLALFNKIEKGIVELNIRFIQSEQLVGLTARGKFKRLVES